METLPLKTCQLNRIAAWLIGVVLALLIPARQIRAAFANGTSGNSSSAQSPKAVVCSAPEYHLFDFWIGDWDAFESGNPNPVARVRVDRILGGCVLHEDYEEPGGAKGQSFSIYDASRKVWHQTWVTNRGKLLIVEGKFQAGEMVLSGIDPAKDDALVRGTWKPIPAGVRETGVLSTDGGKTWKPWFDLYFRPHKRRANS
jgi:hypothetical protein